MMADDMISVPRWALEFILERADFADRGPAGQGWSSEEMKRAQEALEKAFKISASAQI
jgi:hypothetical protein